MRRCRATRRLIGAAGATFTHAYVSYPLCCPSRATLPHAASTRTTTACAATARPTAASRRSTPRHTLPVWLQRAGYDTIHIGKYLNGYGAATPADRAARLDRLARRDRQEHVPDVGLHALRERPARTYGDFDDEDPALYQTDVYRDKALEAIRAHAGGGRPVLPLARRSSPRTARSRGRAARRSRLRPPRAAPRGRFADAAAPARPRSTRPTSATSRRYVRRPARARARADRPRILRDFRARRESLLAVDEAVARDRRRARAHRRARLDLHPVHLRQRLLPGRAPDPEGQVPRLRAVDARAAADPRPGHPGRHALGDELVANIDLAPTIARRHRRRRPTCRSTAARCCPSRATPRCARAGPILHEGLVGGDLDRDGGRAPRRRSVARLLRDPHRRATSTSSGAAARASSTTCGATRPSCARVHADPRYAAVAEQLSLEVKRLRRCDGRGLRRRPVPTQPPTRRAGEVPSTAPAGVARPHRDVARRRADRDARLEARRCAAVRTGASAVGAAPARTSQDATSVAPFQLA